MLKCGSDEDNEEKERYSEKKNEQGKWRTVCAVEKEREETSEEIKEWSFA